MTDRIARLLLTRDAMLSVALVLAVTGVPMRLYTLVHGTQARALWPLAPTLQVVMVCAYVGQLWAAYTGRTAALRWLALAGMAAAGGLMALQLQCCAAVGNWIYWAGVVLVEAWMWWRAGETLRLARNA